MDIYLLIVAYIGVAIFIAWLSFKKGLNWFKLLIFGVLFTPFVSAIIYSNSNPVRVYREKRYKCSRCNYYFTENHANCPHCISDGHEINLKTTWVDMT
jgi:energy-coupling factor transporter transmembrane protein EcfT